MKIIDSVAAVFCHQDHVFAVRRQPYLNAFPGYDSFPGGKIDQEDLGVQHPAQFLCDWDGQAMHALVREIDEELKYDLPAEIVSGQVTAVKYLATALAPAIFAVRFRLHYFRIDVKTRPVFTADSGEIADSFWKTPLQLLNQFDSGNSLMVPPLRWVLERLCRNPQGDNFGDLSPQFDEENYIPDIEMLSGLRMLIVPSNTFPPEKRTNAFLLGDKGSAQILVDPSPESPQVLMKLLRTIRQENLNAIFLTHHHHDHHEYTPELAARLKVPLWMSADTGDRIVKKHGADYFSELQVEIRQAGDSLTNWKGEQVLVHSIPGHDAGQLALAPESLRWFLVGDLIQSVGTVVISAPEGDMATYFQTLKKLISLNPTVVVPSHGMPLRSTFRLQATLQHRIDREKEIRDLHVRGKTPAEMLNLIYHGVNQQLLPFAMENIKSHLIKLKQEKQI